MDITWRLTLFIFLIFLMINEILFTDKKKIEYVEFERHAAGGSNMHYFDLLIRLKTEQEHLFRNIQRNEYHNLFDFIRSL